MFVVYYTIYGPLIQVAVSKSKGNTALFYRQKVLKILKSYIKNDDRRMDLSVKLLHDNAHLQKATAVRIFFEEDKVTVLSHPLIL